MLARNLFLLTVLVLSRHLAAADVVPIAGVWHHPCSKGVIKCGGPGLGYLIGQMGLWPGNES